MTLDTLSLIACTASTAALASWSASRLGHSMLLKGLRPERCPRHTSPESMGIPAQQVHRVRIPPHQGSAHAARDHPQLHALWLVPHAGHPAPWPVVIAQHGWGANGATLLPLAVPLLDMGVAVLLPDARCHGLSDDARFTSLPRFAEDIDATIRWAQMQPQLDTQRLALAGHSVGAGAALLVASRRSDIRGVLSLSAFAHPSEVMQRWMNAMRIPQWLLGSWILRHVQQVIGASFDDIAPLRSASQLRCPVLFVHGENDLTVPSSDALRLMAAVTHTWASTMVIPGGHDLNGRLDARHAPHIQGFFRRAFVGETPPHCPVTCARAPHTTGDHDVHQTTSPR